MAEEISNNGKWKTTFFLIWTGQMFSVIGSSLVQFALVWWMTEKTGSAAVLATASIISLLPQVVLGPFVGALVDRWNRKIVMMVADSTVALTTVVLVFLFWSGQIQIWHLFVAQFIRALGGTFHYPAMSASTSLLVPEKHLSRIAGINQAMYGMLNIIAPPLGAFLMSVLPIYTVLSIDIFTAMLAVAPLFFVFIPQPKTQLAGSVSVKQVLIDVREGLAFVVRWPGMVVILLMATMINMLFNPAFSLMPLMITREFNGGAMQLGVMNSAWGVGVIIGGLGLSVWGGFKQKIFTSMTGLVGMGLGTLLIGLTPNNLFWMALAGMALAGVMNPITNGPLFALLQSTIKPEMQGRVFTLVGSLSAAASPLGLAISAPVADTLGVRFWFYIAGIACAAMGLLGFMLAPLRNLENDMKSEMAAIPDAIPVAAQD